MVQFIDKLYIKEMSEGTICATYTIAIKGFNDFIDRFNSSMFKASEESKNFSLLHPDYLKTHKLYTEVEPCIRGTIGCSLNSDYYKSYEYGETIRIIPISNQPYVKQGVGYSIGFKSKEEMTPERLSRFKEECLQLANDLSLCLNFMYKEDPVTLNVVLEELETLCKLEVLSTTVKLSQSVYNAVTDYCSTHDGFKATKKNYFNSDCTEISYKGHLITVIGKSNNIYQKYTNVQVLHILFKDTWGYTMVKLNIATNDYTDNAFDTNKIKNKLIRKENDMTLKDAVKEMMDNAAKAKCNSEYIYVDKAIVDFIISNDKYCNINNDTTIVTDEGVIKFNITEYPLESKYRLSIDFNNSESNVAKYSYAPAVVLNMIAATISRDVSSVYSILNKLIKQCESPIDVVKINDKVYVVSTFIKYEDGDLLSHMSTEDNIKSIVDDMNDENISYHSFYEDALPMKLSGYTIYSSYFNIDIVNDGIYVTVTDLDYEEGDNIISNDEDLFKIICNLHETFD